MKRAAFAALAVVAAAGLLARSAAPVAHACSCEMAPAREGIERSQVVLVGETVSFARTPSKLVREGEAFYEYGDRMKAKINVEKYLKGSGPREIDVQDGICVAGIDREQVGRAHLLFLRFEEQFGRVPMAEGCLGSGPVEGGWSPVRLSEVESITGPGEPPDNSLDEPRPPDSGGFPLGAASALAIVGPVAFLLGAAFLWPRRRSPL